MQSAEHLTVGRKMSSEEWYADLASHEIASDMSDDELIWHTGALLQVSQLLWRREGVERAIAWALPLDEHPLTPEQKVSHNYTLANAWAELHDMQETHDRQADLWNQPQRQQALRYYRLALIASAEAQQPDRKLHCEILTNLANLYSSVGHTVAALACWTQVLSIDPAFGMARGNRGIALAEYARLIRGDLSQYIVLHHARVDLLEAVDAGPPPHAMPHFRTKLEAVERALEDFTVAEDLKWQEADALGDSIEERDYRQWCLDNTLVLHPLNDLGPLKIASCDALALPGIATAVREMIPHFHALYNQLKQEYIAARYCLYEGLTNRTPQFVDRGRHLTNTLDYHALSLDVEKTRIAFRIGYSILDKVGHFLHEYLRLEPIERISFRSVWYVKGQRERGLHPTLHDIDNRPLRGLFWLSKDLLAKGWAPAEAIEPEAAQLANLRNALEHTALHVHEPVPVDVSHRMTPMALHIEKDDFERKTLRLLQMSRAALLYTALAVGVEEEQRRQGRIIPQIHLDPL